MAGRWRWWHTVLLLIVIPALIGVASWYLDQLVAWYADMALLAVFVVVLGIVITGLVRGVFVDDRNKVSLSRFQAVLWTILVLGGYLAIVVRRIHDGVADPLVVPIPAELFWVMGISATSLVGSPLVRSVHERKAGAEDRIRWGLAQAGRPAKVAFVRRDAMDESTKAVLVRGKVAVNVVPSDSSWGDMFRGEEVVTAPFVDLGKVQMFFFTLIAVTAYAVTLGKSLTGDAPVSGFPALEEGLVALLAISHGAYLANKSVERTPDA